jgi:hypothetical protein
MDAKKAGIIALIVVAVGLLIWSFKNSFGQEAPAAGASEAEKMKAAMIKMRDGGAPPPAPGSRPGTAGHTPAIK